MDRINIQYFEGVTSSQYKAHMKELKLTPVRMYSLISSACTYACACVQARKR